MRYLFFFLLVGLTSIINAQNKWVKQPNCNEIEGLQVEPQDHFFENDSLVPDNYTGVLKTCENGKVTHFSNMKNGKLDGMFRFWNKNGLEWGEATYIDGKANGLYRSWYSNGQMKEEANFQDGKRNGLSRVWYENGQLSYETNHNYDKLHGLSRSWYENGQLNYEYQNDNGKQNGLQRVWHEDGRLWFEQNYKDGVKIYDSRFGDMAKPE